MVDDLVLMGLKRNGAGAFDVLNAQLADASPLAFESLQGLGCSQCLHGLDDLVVFGLGLVGSQTLQGGGPDGGAFRFEEWTSTGGCRGFAGGGMTMRLCRVPLVQFQSR